MNSNDSWASGLSDLVVGVSLMDGGLHVGIF
jgi:hypothetical protein